VARVAAELKATFGTAATLCIDSDDKGAPGAPEGHSHQDCPFCRFSVEAATLIGPDVPVLTTPLYFSFFSIAARADANAGPLASLSRPRARAPPFSV
jgi:hypothetical protein